MCRASSVLIAPSSAALGINVAEPALDIDKAQDRKQKVVDSNATGVEFLFKKNKVTGLRGFGRVTGPHEVEVEGPDG